MDGCNVDANAHNTNEFEFHRRWLFPWWSAPVSTIQVQLHLEWNGAKNNSSHSSNDLHNSFNQSGLGDMDV
jgi:hypothetical protein